MISDYLMKGIDSIFSRGLETLSSQSQNRTFNRQIIKANLQSVIKEAPKINKSNSQENQIENGTLSKSRLRMILEKNKDAQIKSVIRRDNSRSLSPYQRINVVNGNSPLKTQGVIGDKITYYREQRKTIQKSRVLQKSRLGGTNSRIFRVGSQAKMVQNKENTLKASPSCVNVHKNPLRVC